MICASCIIGHGDASHDIPVISIVLATMHCQREDGMRCSWDRRLIKQSLPTSRESRTVGMHAGQGAAKCPSTGQATN